MTEPERSAASDTRPPLHSAGIQKLHKGMSRSFSSTFGATSQQAATADAAVQSGGGGEGADSPSHSRGSSRASGSHSFSQRLGGVSGKLAAKLHRSRSENGSGHGGNAAMEALRRGFGGGSEDGSIHESGSSHNLLFAGASDASSAIYRKASSTWDFGYYPTDAQAYELVEAVGEGATATVWLAYCPITDSDVAVKIVNLDDPSISLPSIIHEVQTMKLLKHPNILPLYAAFLEDDQLWMVMPYVSGGSAGDIMRRNNSSGLNEHCIATIMRPVLHALAYLHKDGYIHRDLKAGNILIDQRGQVILADMGVAAAMARSHRLHSGEGNSPQVPRASADGMAAYLSRTTFAGTPCWMAPEVMEDGQSYDCSADIWSFGITLLELALGAAPLQNFNLDQILMKTLNEPPPVLESSDRRKRFTEDLQDLVAKCLQKDPTQRAPAAKLVKHRFFKGAYDGAYLVKQLDIGDGAALGAHAAASRGVLSRAIVGAARQFTDKGSRHQRWNASHKRGRGMRQAADPGLRKLLLGHEQHLDIRITQTAKLTGEEVDAQDAFKLLRRLTLPPKWLPEGSEPLDITAIRSAKGLAFGMLKSTGTGVKFLRGSGFVLGRSVNSRRETRWSAPSYFTIDIRGLPPQFRNMAQVHLVMVLSSQEALDRLKASETDFEADDDGADDGAEALPGSPPKGRLRQRLGRSLFGSGAFSAAGLSPGSFGKSRRHTADELHAADHSHSSRSGGPPPVGYAIEYGSDRPFQLPLHGVRIAVDKKQNSTLYGEDANVESILDIKLTKRPAPFDRLVKDIEQMVEGAQLAEKSPEDAQWFKNQYFFQ